jgi:hypothetical protein
MVAISLGDAAFPAWRAGGTTRVRGNADSYQFQSLSGNIACDSEPSGVKCTDSSTGHYFRVSRESYDLG